MFSRLLSKHAFTTLLIGVFFALIVTVYLGFKSIPPSYEGKEVELTKVDGDSSIQINNAVLSSMPPKIKSGEQAMIQITKFAGNYAQGTVSYSQASPTQQFMVAKVLNSWKVITHNTGKELGLPDIKTAERYKLPKDWYKP